MAHRRSSGKSPSVTSTRFTHLGTTTDTLTGRGGLALFSRYLANSGVYHSLERLLGAMRRSRKGIGIIALFHQLFCFLADGTNWHLVYFDALRRDEGHARGIETEPGQMASSHQIKRFYGAFAWRRISSAVCYADFFSGDSASIPWSWTTTRRNLGRGASPLTRRSRVFGRTRTGTTLEGAQAELDLLMPKIRDAFPWKMEDWGRGAGVVPLREAIIGDVRPMLLILLGAVGFVLLIACVNVVNLLLARMATRQREVALRTALGAGRGRILRQLLTESLLVALLAGSAGLLLASAGIPTLISTLPAGVPRIDEIGLDFRVLGFATMITVFTGLTIGLVPALRASRADPQVMLREGGRGSGAGREHRRASAGARDLRDRDRRRARHWGWASDSELLADAPRRPRIPHGKHSGGDCLAPGIPLS